MIRNVKIGTLLIGGTVLSVAIIWSYANSITALYAALSIAIMIFAFGGFLINLNFIDRRYRNICLFLLFESLFTGVFLRWNAKSMLLVNTSLLLPAVVSVLEIDFYKAKRISMLASIASLALMYLQTTSYILGAINSNTISFLTYTCVSTGFIWFEMSERKLLPTIYALLSVTVFWATGSRNAAIVFVMALILLAIPRWLLTNKLVYRLIYGLSLLYTVLASKIMTWGFSNPLLSQYLYSYVNGFSNKGWAMESRAEFLWKIGEKIENLSFLTKLFGEGVCAHLGHNLWYQCIFMWGYIGAILVYILLIRVFEMAYAEIASGNSLIAGCFVILVGHILINGADVYLFGAETCQVLAMVIIGLIMQQYRANIMKKPEIYDE